MRRKRARSRWAARTSRSRSRARSAICRRSTTSGSARASTRWSSWRARSKASMDVRDVRGLALRHDGEHRAHAAAPARGRSRPPADSRARAGAARALPRLRQPRERRHLARLSLRVRLLLGAGLDRAQRALPHAVAVRRRDRDARGPRLHRDHDRGRSLHALPQALHGRLRRARAPQHRHPLERLLARRHHLARDRRDDGARGLPGHLLRRRERQPGGARPGQEALEPRQGEGGHAHDAGRRHQRAGLLHHRPAGRDRGDAAQDRRVRERAAPGVRVALRLPHPGALPRHRGARQGQGLRPRDPQRRLDAVRRQPRGDAHARAPTPP